MLLACLIGFTFGFIGSMPVAGPIALLVLRLGLNHDLRHARFVALGGALAEGIYALLAFWGLSQALERYPMILPASRLVGAAICLVLGIALLAHRPKIQVGPAPHPARGPVKGTKRSFLGGFLITALNPTLLVTWTAALAALHATGLVTLAARAAIPFALAAFLGILAWFATLLALVRRFKHRWSPRAVQGFIQVMGVLLVVAAGWVVARALFLARAARRAPSRGNYIWKIPGNAPSRPHAKGEGQAPPRCSLPQGSMLLGQCFRRNHGTGWKDRVGVWWAPGGVHRGIRTGGDGVVQFPQFPESGRGCPVGSGGERLPAAQ